MSAPFTIEPFAFGIGPLQLTGFGIAILFAFGISNYVLQHELMRRGHEAEAVGTSDVTTAALIGTLVGGKLYYVALRGDITALWSRSGFVFWGGFIGSVLFCYLTIHRKKLSFVRYSDAAGIAIAAGYSVGRTGCWAVGDDYGQPWNGPLAVTFPHGTPPSTAENLVSVGAKLPFGTAPNAIISVHPTQLYEVAMGFVMFMILWRFRTHRHREGWLFGFYCLLAGIERFVVEFFRAKDDRFVGPFTTAQVIAMSIAAVGIVWMYARRATSDTAPPTLASARA